MTWKIFIVTNNIINDDYYKDDDDFGGEHWSFFNVSNEKRMISDKFDVINAIDIQNYEFKGRTWAESEVIYNIYKLDMFKQYDFIGFIHYDFYLKNVKDNTTDITRQIDNTIHTNYWITFRDYTANALFKNTPMVIDDRYPEIGFVSDNTNGISDLTLANPIFINVLKNNTPFKLTLRDIDMKRHVSLCSAFMTKRRYVVDIGRLMDIMCKTYEIEYINSIYDKRYIGNLFERLISWYSYSFDKRVIELDHKFQSCSKGGR